MNAEEDMNAREDNVLKVGLSVAYFLAVQRHGLIFSVVGSITFRFSNHFSLNKVFE